MPMIRSGHGYDVELSFDGDITGEPELLVEPVDAVRMVVKSPFDPATDKMTIAIDHAGSAGVGIVTSVFTGGRTPEDGPDWVETWDALAPGATTVSAVIGAERPTV